MLSALSARPWRRAQSGRGGLSGGVSGSFSSSVDCDGGRWGATDVGSGASNALSSSGGSPSGVRGEWKGVGNGVDGRLMRRGGGRPAGVDFGEVASGCATGREGPPRRVSVALAANTAGLRSVRRPSAGARRLFGAAPSSWGRSASADFAGGMPERSMAGGAVGTFKGGAEGWAASVASGFGLGRLWGPNWAATGASGDLAVAERLMSAQAWRLSALRCEPWMSSRSEPNWSG